MTDRWRGRKAGLAAGILLLALILLGSLAALTGATTGRDGALRLLVTDASGAQLAAVPLPADGRFTLRYRNSVYRSLAEERFVAGAAGRFELRELASDELAVLDEYFVAIATEPAPAGDPRRFVGRPAHEVVLDELTLAATDRGERTLIVSGGGELPLWPLVEDEAPSVTLRVEASAP